MMTTDRKIFCLAALSLMVGLTYPRSAQGQESGNNPKVIYGVDDRIDVYEETDPGRLAQARSTCGILSRNRLVDNNDGTYTILTPFFDVCPSEPFSSQPVPMFCTGFMVGDRRITTAGHCLDETRIDNAAIVFGFEMLDANTPVTTVNADQVYFPTTIISQALSGTVDYCVFDVDRDITAPGASALPLRPSGSVELGQQVGVIGHPSGLPMKIAFGASTVVTKIDDANVFEANLDTYGGNSGSPVFDQATGAVEGILVTGATDYVTIEENGVPCRVSNVLDDSAGSEGVTRSSVFAAFVSDSEGEGVVEGSTEGEGALEGTIDGEGLAEGNADGEGEGIAEGNIEGEGEGIAEGSVEGEREGIAEGSVEGEGEGIAEGSVEGEGEGIAEGSVEGEGEGIAEGSVEGEREGIAEGSVEGEGEGIAEGSVEGEGEGIAEGSVEGEGEGIAEGGEEGEGEGVVEGSEEGEGVEEGEGDADDVYEQLLYAFAAAESTGNNTLTLSEIQSQLPGFTEADLDDADYNGDGQLSVAELLQRLGGGILISADTNGDFLIALEELLRLIQLFNAGQYACAENAGASEDGYLPRAQQGGDPACLLHSIDGDGNNQITLSELLRGIQFYNLGGYTYCQEQSPEDGFCG
jgi:V8-like Glu-specific endopeptidase